MNIPNSLTILRILLIPCYIGLLIYGRFDQALIVLLVAGLTDALDGLIARMKNQHTRLGAVLDPLADKLLLTSGVHHPFADSCNSVVGHHPCGQPGRYIADGNGGGAFHRLSRGSYAHLFGQGHDVSPASLCCDGYLSQFPPHRSRQYLAAVVRYGLLHVIVRIALSLSRYSADECNQELGLSVTPTCMPAHLAEIVHLFDRFWGRQ